MRTITNNVESEYDLHISNVLVEKIRQTVLDESKRGFQIPTGMLNGKIIEIYCEEFTFFGQLLENSIKSAVVGINAKELSSYLTTRSCELLKKHRNMIKDEYRKTANIYWNGRIGEHDLNEHFSKVADKKVELQVKRICSIIDFAKITD